MDILFDALFLLSKADSGYHLRVPLSVLIDYKGFRCLAIGVLPISSTHPPCLGFTDGNYRSDDPDLRSAVATVGDVLRLKDNVVRSTKDGRQAASRQNLTNEKVPLSSFVKVYSHSPSQETKTKKS